MPSVASVSPIVITIHLREMSRLEDENAFSSECVPHQRQITGLLLASHCLNNSGDLVSMDQLL